MKKLLVLGGLFLLAFVLLAPTNGVCAEKLQRKIQIGSLPINVMTVPYAEYMGAWKEEGLDVEVKIFQGGPALVEALMAGGLDAADIGYVPMIYAATRNIPLYYLASDGVMTKDYPMYVITVSPDSNIKSFTDLKGKTIAIHQRGTMQDAWLSAICEKYGMSKSDIKITFVPVPQQGGVLAHKQVDATFPDPPYDALQEINKQGRVLFDLSEVIPDTEISGLVVSRKFANEYPEATRKLVKGYVKAGRWVNDNQKLARQKVLTDKRYMGMPANIADIVRMPYWPRNGFHLMPSVWNIYNLMVKTGMIPAWENAAARMNEYWVEPTMKYTLPAVKELGLQDDPYIRKVERIPLPYLDKKPESYFAPWEKQEGGLTGAKPGQKK